VPITSDQWQIVAIMRQLLEREASVLAAIRDRKAQARGASDHLCANFAFHLIIKRFLIDPAETDGYHAGNFVPGAAT